MQIQNIQAKNVLIVILYIKQKIENMYANHVDIQHIEID